MAREVDGAAIDRRGVIPESVRSGAASLGLFGMSIPEEHGGAGLSLRAVCDVISEMARADRSVAIMVGLHAGLGTRGPVELGTKAVRDAYLPRLASGEWIASFAATEAGAGSDLASLRTRGEVVGDTLRLTGEKAYVTNGGFASSFTVLARTPGFGGARGHSLVFVPRETPGVEIGAEEDKLGIRGSSTVTVSFDGATVPLDHVLGTPGRGMEHAYHLLTWGRTLMSAGCVGTGRAALDAALAHVTTRRQFGKPIGDFAATRLHIARMAARLYAMESVVRGVADVHASGGSLEAVSAIAKVFASEGAFKLVDRALQLQGALGFLEGPGVARLLRDCRITRIFEGANDVLLLRVGLARLAAHDVPRGHILGVVPAPLRSAASEVDGLAERLGEVVADVRARHGVTAVRHQLVLQRLAVAEISLYAATNSVLGASSEEQFALASHATDLLIEEATTSLDALSRADADERRALAMSEVLYAPYRDGRDAPGLSP